jgi:hypothetical protein
MNRKPDVSELVTVAVFGALGGAFEIGVGSFIHSFPFFPFRGLIMSGISGVILISSQVFTRQKYTPFWVGGIMAILKLLSPGGAMMSPVIAILFESFVLGGMLALFPQDTRFGVVCASSAACLYSIAHKLLFQGLLMGCGIYNMYLSLLHEIFTKAHLSQVHVYWMMIPVVILHVGVGAFSGLQGLRLGQYLRCAAGRPR